ncbi:MAG: 3-hydroxyacyl-CoA dehydrogenase [Aaplasma endosymbiont of Hyalomma asiaticum]
MIGRFVDSGIDTVVYCDSSVVDAGNVCAEVRSYTGGFCDARDLKCIIEFIGNLEGKIAFYRDMAAVENSDALVFSYDISQSTWDALCVSVSQSILGNVVSVNFPTFYQRVLVLECVTYRENALKRVYALQKECSGKLALVISSNVRLKLFDRIGYFLAVSCINAAFELGVDIEVADHLVANESTGVPNPGVFAILDHMGLDNFLVKLKELIEFLENDDPLREMYKVLPYVIHAMISDELTGLNGRGGFYRTYKMRYGRVDQVIDLKSGLYRALKRDKFLQESVLNRKEKCDEFFSSVWGSFFKYIKYLVELYGESVMRHIDEVLMVGYQWRYGVEELATRFSMRDLLNGD